MEFTHDGDEVVSVSVLFMRLKYFLFLLNFSYFFFLLVSYVHFIASWYLVKDIDFSYLKFTIQKFQYATIRN